LVHQELREVEVLGFDAGAIANRDRFETDAPIRSRVLPGFNLSAAEIFGPF
jgi:hypothetical protein